MTNNKKALFYVVIFFISLLIALLIVEVILNGLEFSTGAGRGKVSENWFKKNWKPINSYGYRDYEWANAPERNSIVFLGDSFTAGHGVKFEQTYYFKTRETLGRKYSTFNLGQNGADTEQEALNYNKFRSVTKIKPQFVVHQYFLNDIDKYIDLPKFEPWKPVMAAVKHSEFLSLLGTYIYFKNQGQSFADATLRAYENESMFLLHKAELLTLFKSIHDDGASIIFITFPYLSNDMMLAKSEYPISKVKKVFLDACRKNDVFFDVSGLARALADDKRTANILDAHPSPLLHQLVSDQLLKYLGNAEVEAEMTDLKMGGSDFVIRCQ